MSTDERMKLAIAKLRGLTPIDFKAYHAAIDEAEAALRAPEAADAGAVADPLASLVSRFSEALLAKLQAARVKYGYNEDWQKPGWQDDCQHHLIKHLAKGDPRDVAAYCAFMWHHGWSTTAPPSKACCKGLAPANECWCDTQEKAATPTAAGIAAPPAALYHIAQQIKGWLKWDREHRRRENLTTDENTSIMSLPVPFWPSHGQFERWIEALEAPAASADAVREALEPFANLVPAAFPPKYDDNWEVTLHLDVGDAVASLRVRDFRAARAALSAPVAGADAAMRERCG